MGDDQIIEDIDQGNQVTPPTSTNMPPIFRPEDIQDSVAVPEVVASPLPESEIPSMDVPLVADPPDAVPSSAADEMESLAEPETYYAPMPQIPEEVAPAPKTEPIPRSYVAMAPPNPAMVADPLMHEDVFVAQGSSVAVDGSIIPPKPQAAAPAPPRPSFMKTRLAKILGYVSLGIFVVGSLVGGYFGYQSYATQKSAQTLAAAMKALFTTTGVEHSIVITDSAGQTKYTYDIDASGNQRLSGGGKEPISAVYLKAKDTIYYSVNAAGTPKYNEIKKVAAGIDFIGNSYANLKPALAGELLSSSATISRLKSGGSELVEGKDAYKFTYTATTDELDILLEELIGESYPGTLVASDKVSIDVFVDKKLGKILKITGKFEGTTAAKSSSVVPADGEDNVTQGITIKPNFSFDWTVNYAYAETIKLPIGSKIASSMTLEKLYDDNFGSGFQNKSKDSSEIANASEIDYAVTQYFIDNGDYPAATNIDELVAILSAGVLSTHIWRFF